MAVEADLLDGELTAERAAKRAVESRERVTAAYLDLATAHDLAARAYVLATKTDPAHAEEYRRHAQQHRADAEAARHRARLECSPGHQCRDGRQGVVDRRTETRLAGPMSRQPTP